MCATPGAHGVNPDLFRKLDEGHIDLVLDERRARCCRSLEGSATVHDHNAVAIRGEHLGDERTGNARANYKNICREVVTQMARRYTRSTPLLPDRETGPKVTLCRTHAGSYEGSSQQSSQPPALIQHQPRS